MSIDIFLYVFTATNAHLMMSLGQTLFHRCLEGKTTTCYNPIGGPATLGVPDQSPG